jgi:nucleoside-diphosphate-sugar epimerase
MSSPKPLVLISGLNGYLASSIALAFLDAGYSVRGTVRRQEQADAWNERYPGKVDIAVVPDMTVEGAYDEAVKGVEVFVHTASPFIFGEQLSLPLENSILTR